MHFTSHKEPSLMRALVGSIIYREASKFWGRGKLTRTTNHYLWAACPLSMSRSSLFSFTSVISKTGTWCLPLFQVTSLFLGRDFQRYSKDLIGYWFVIWENLTHTFQRFPLRNCYQNCITTYIYWSKLQKTKWPMLLVLFLLYLVLLLLK